jgi:hypothetical protein
VKTLPSALTFYESECSLPLSQKFAISLYPDADKINPRTPALQPSRNFLHVFFPQFHA